MGIEKAASATRKRETDYLEEREGTEARYADISHSESYSVLKGSGQILKMPPLRKVIRERRSAIEMDNSAYMEKETFYAMLQKTLPEK